MPGCARAAPTPPAALPTSCVKQIAGRTHGAWPTAAIHSVVSVWREDVGFSITLRQQKPAQCHRGHTCLAPIPYWTDGVRCGRDHLYPLPALSPTPRCGSSWRVKPTPGSQLALFATYSIMASSPTAMGRCWNWRPMSRRDRECDTRPQVRCRTEPHAVLADSPPWLAVQVIAQPGLSPPGSVVTTKTLRRRVSAGRGHGLTLHLTALALGYPVQSRGPAASHSLPASATAPEPPNGQPNVPAISHQPGPRAPLPCPWALHSHCRPPSVPPKAPADRPPTCRLPKFEPDHRACNSLTPFRCPHAVHPCPSVDSG